MRDNSLRTMLYGLARCGIFILLNIFATIIGKTAILCVVGTFIPRLHLYNKPELLAFLSWLIPSITLIALFADDAKRHTAYGRYNPTAVVITMFLTSVVYYFPVFLLEYITDKKGVLAIEGLYFTSSWISAFNFEIEIYALIGTIILMILSIVSYIIARIYYLKKFESGEYEYEYEE